MPDQAVSVLDGSNFVVSDRRGDVLAGATLRPHGFFSQDTRFVSRWRLTVQGRPPDILSRAHTDYFVAQFFLVSPSEAFHVGAPLGIARQRLIGDVWMEDVVVVNHRNDHAELAIDLEVAADFADLFEVKDKQIRGRRVVAERGDRELVLRYRNGDFVRETRITVSDPASIEDDAIRLNLRLAPREERRISFVITPHSGRRDRTHTARRRAGSFAELRRERLAEVGAWVAEAPTLQTDDDALRHAYDRSLTDLAALRFYPHIGLQDVSLPAAGLPWFMTLFGRDSLITSYQVLPYRPELAGATLTALAARQGTVCDDFRDEEPGKILHEVRFGELTVTGERPHSPYYGTADATPLFLIVLEEYERWSGDAELVRALEVPARLALEWIDRYGDLDGDGYVEYETRNPETGLQNQCWKDSWNSIAFADGRLAEGPVAVCEIQGYVYDAKLRAARLAREVWDDPPLAQRLEAQAVALKERFLEDFWNPDRGCFVLALDGAKRQVDSLTSNIGQLLWSGIVDDARADAVVSQLMAAPLYSGWGVRTMASSEGAYNPVEYHNGTVWPHDNSLIAAGLRRYGHDDAAARIADAVVRAARYFDYRLPEVFAGYDEQLTHIPVSYPTASSPQAWAAGAPLLLLTTTLGLGPDGDGLRSDPHLPARFGHVELHGVPGRWGRADVVAGEHVAQGRAPAAR
jgi:glycogen debranching enzyme